VTNSKDYIPEDGVLDFAANKVRPEKEGEAPIAITNTMFYGAEEKKNQVGDVYKIRPEAQGPESEL